jgi:hypothetical protein
MPVWVPHGTRGDFKDFSGADWTASRRELAAAAFEAGALPHFEHPGGVRHVVPARSSRD